MNMQQLTRSAVLLVLVSSLAACAAGGYGRNNGYGSGGYGYDRGACSMCGVVQDIDPVYYSQGQDTAALGTILGAVIGAAAGNQVGGGSGKKAATIGGAIAGGVIGHEIDQRNDGDARVWRISVRLDNGRYATVTQREDPRVSVGDYVLVRDDHVYAR